MGRLSQLAKKTIKEITKPKGFVKGEDFEDYIRKYMFPQEKYDLIHRTHNYEDNVGDYIETTLQPDFLFRDRTNKKEFYVEAKFRSYYMKDSIEWCKKGQMSRYKKVDKKHPVFIVIGVGGKPKYPEELILIPVRKIKYQSLFKSFLKDYSFPYLDKPVFSKYLWSLL